MANDKLFCIYVKDDGTPGDGGAHGRKIYLTGSEGVKEINVKIPACAPGQSILTVGEYIAHIQGAMVAGKYPKATKPYAAGYLWARSMGAPADLLSKILSGIVAVVQKNNDPSEKGALAKLHARLASEAPAPKPVAAPVVPKPVAQVAALAPVAPPAPVAAPETKMDRFQLLDLEWGDPAPAPVKTEKACGLPCIYSPGKGCPTCEARWANEAKAHAAAKAAAAAAPKPVVALPGARIIDLTGDETVSPDLSPVPETSDGSCGFDENRMGYTGASDPQTPLADRFSLIELD
jgi:hypothetical protein